MSKPKHTLDERVADQQAKLQAMLEKVRQQEAQLKKLEARQKDEERRKRTHRLIEVGAAVESVLGQSIEKSDLEKLIFFLKDQEERGHYFSKAMGTYVEYSDSDNSGNVDNSNRSF